MKTREEVEQVAAGRESRMAVYRRRPVKGIGMWEIRGRRELARMVRKLREQRGMSRTEVAAKARMGFFTLGYIERAERTPSVPVLRGLAHALSVDTLALVEALLIDELAAEETEPGATTPSRAEGAAK